nr:hypothetical protein [Tanacetum cinerariifolium]
MSTNYTIWRMRMEVLLRIQSILEDLVWQIKNLKTKKEMWEAIKIHYLGADRVKEVRLQTLVTEFENMKMLINDIIDSYAAKLLGIASKTATLREVMSEHKLDVVGRLKTYEERIKEEDKANDPQENSLYARTGYSNRNNDSSRGRGCASYSRGPGYGRGQDSGRGNTQNHRQRDSSKNRKDNEQKCKEHKKRNLSHIICYHCDEYGHFVSRCPQRNRDYEANLTKTHGGDVNHEEGNYSYISELNENINGRVRFGDGSPESEEDNSRSNDTPNLLVRLETIRLLITLATKKGWKDHHLDVKTVFLNVDQKKINSTLKEMGFLQCVHKMAVYRKVPNREFIIVAVYKDDLFVTGTSLDLINEFKMRMASQFEISDLGELTYYLRIKVSQRKDCTEICNEDLKRSCHNVDIDDGRSTTGHVFYLAACQEIWLSERLAEVTKNEQVCRVLAAYTSDYHIVAMNFQYDMQGFKDMVL